ncbi:hypothetical protein [Kordia sp.]|uniref:hypothetical protein n=1 Tax=Kordia sp. TaxID=1965332 RepID=UPI003D6C4B3F
MEKFIDIRIEDKFKIGEEIKEKFKVEFPLVIMGAIDVQYYGKLEEGNYIKFKIEEQTLLRKIIGIEYLRPSHYLEYMEVKTRGAGLLIECKSEEEFYKILKVESIYQTATIYKTTK